MHSQFMTQLAQEAKQLIGENDDLARSYLDVLCKQIEKFNSSEEVVASAPARYPAVRLGHCGLGPETALEAAPRRGAGTGSQTG